MVMLGSTVFQVLVGASLLSSFALMVRPKFLQAIENLSTLFRMLALVVMFSVQLLANRNPLMISLHLSLRRLKTEQSVWYQTSILLSEPLNASQKT